MNDNVFGAGQAPSSEEQVPVENLSYEQARDALVETVKLLELGQMSLDDPGAVGARRGAGPPL